MRPGPPASGWLRTSRDWGVTTCVPIAGLVPAAPPLPFTPSFQCRLWGWGLRPPVCTRSSMTCTCVLLGHACCMCLPEARCVLCTRTGHMHRAWRVYGGRAAGCTVRVCELAQAREWAYRTEAHARGFAHRRPLRRHCGTCTGRVHRHCPLARTRRNTSYTHVLRKGLHIGT